MSGNYQAVVGLEVHIQLATGRKLLCGCKTGFGAAPNTQICPVCCGQPGALPVLDPRAVEYGQLLALALSSTPHQNSRFARKSYFYPDLPKGYQITQYEHPLATGGTLSYCSKGELFHVPLERLHLEEDAGRLKHQRAMTLVDFNRAGTPLVELVTTPSLRSAEEAAAALRALRTLVRWIGISEGNLEQGSMRCDANISLRSRGSTELGTRCELKNLNSFRLLRQALSCEIRRQTDLLNDGRPVIQQTRRFDARQNRTIASRSKEVARDYRYFDEPDLPPIALLPPRELPELPLQRRSRFIDALAITPAAASELCKHRQLADYFEEVLRFTDIAPQAVAHWLLGELLARVDDLRTLDRCVVSPRRTAELLMLLHGAELDRRQAKEVWKKLWITPNTPRECARILGFFKQGPPLQDLIETVLKGRPQEVAAYHAGRLQVLDFLVGQVLRRAEGMADARSVKQLLVRSLQRDYKNNNDR